jgi:DNA-3-methyladenine glycosylase
MPKLLPQSFYARDALDVAYELIGAHLVVPGVVLRVTEVEAYRSNGDTANHCFVGRTARNEAMWGPPGHAYIYLCYGMHLMLNLVTDADGIGAAVLVRSAEIVRGEELVFERRRYRGVGLAQLTAGPGKVAQALGLSRDHNHHALFRRGALEVREGRAASRIVTGPRVGIDYAALEHRLAAWRIADGDSASVSMRKGLSPDAGDGP